MALFGCVDEELDAMPVLNDGILRESGAEDFVPADHLLVMVSEDFLDAGTEVRLEFDGCLVAVGGHECLNLRVGAPLFTVALVAANVHIGIGKETAHFVEEGVEKFEGGLSSGVEGSILNAEAIGDGIGAGGTAEVWIADKPALDVAGHVELGDDADAARGGIGDDFADLVLGVELAV